MQTDKNPDKNKFDDIVDVEELTEEEKLQWLLDNESSEAEETLFRVLQEEYRDEGLSEFEAEIAGRPMVRGNAGGDDWANFVSEEIVISSDATQSDIYGTSDSEPADDENDAQPEQIMAIDHSRRREAPEQSNTASVADGADVLGLSAEDDIGDTFLTIKRVKGSAGPATKDSIIRPETPMPPNAQSSARKSSGEWTESAANSPDALSPGDTKDPDGPVLTLDSLADAPVPRRVADPAEQQVANEDQMDTDQMSEPVFAGAVEQRADDQADTAERQDSSIEPAFSMEGDGFDTGHESAVADAAGMPGDDGDSDEFTSVLDYVASTPQPEDEDAFDEYLLKGQGLTAYDGDVEELRVEENSEALSVDISSPRDIDYRDVFSEMDDDAADVAAALPAIMQEISQAVEVRAAEIGIAEQALSVEVMLGTDAVSVEHCRESGCQPLCSIFPGVPRASEHLSREARETIYIRIYDAADGTSRNDLFDAGGGEDFGIVGDDSFAAELPDVEGGEDFEIAEDDFAAELLAEDDGEEPELAADEFATELLEENEGEDFEAGGDDFAGELTVEDESEAVEYGSEAFAAELHTTAESGFGEDIFGEELQREFDSSLSEAQPTAANIEDVFAVSGEMLGGGGADDICGIDVDEFATDESIGVLEQQVAHTGENDGVDVVEQAGDSASPDVSWCIPPHIKFSYTTQSGSEVFDDFLDAFIEEGSAEIEKLEDLIGEWERDVTEEEVVAGISRTLHTIKGIAKGVGLQRFGTLIHNFETLLEALPRPNADEAQPYFRIINVWLDTVVRGIEFVTEQRRDIASELPQAGDGATRPETAEVESPGPSAGVPATPVEEEAAGALLTQDNAGVESVSREVSKREKKRDQQLADEGAKALAAQQSVRITSEKLDHLLNLASQTQQLCVRASQTTTRGKRSTAELQGRLSSVRNHIAKIADRALLSVNARGGGSKPEMDALEMDQYSELQEAASILREGVEDLTDLVEVLSRQNSQVEGLLKQQSAVISSISSSVQAARVVPVSRLMPGLRRIVRTVSADLGKVVSFKVLNEIGSLDRDRYARLQVALEHMVRNALDHGIEAPQDRLAVGKPRAGLITIDVRKSGGDYVITLADDGRGIDPDVIRESAYQKGLDVDVDALSDEEAIRLVFHKGFSTASELSEISGRGVGMDIVLTELQQIGGDIQIQSAVGVGTSLEVRIPSNVTVNGALLVTAADHAYAIPLNGLIAVEQIAVARFFEAIENGGTLSLYDMDCKPAYLATLCQGVGLPERSFWESFVPVIIAGSEDQYMAIAIDNVQEALELVVRSLGSQFSAVPGLAGAATTADGDALVALDLNLLVDSVGDTGLAPVTTSHDSREALLALVVDDSRTQRMVATSQLDTVGVETVTAENGLVAIDLLNATHRLPDVVLLDVEMPIKDGIETLREIRKSRRYGHLPVIMVTSRTGAKHRAMAKEAGCNAYMGKPFNFPALVEQINVLTGHDLQVS
ncbi:MAG: response regulator [Halioglobus sp.]|nr:response regulator [Halioglobus sp.]